MLGQAVVVYCLTQSQNWPFLGLKTTLKATDSAPRLQFQFTSLFSPPSKYWANFDNQFTTLLSQVRKPGLDAQPFALRPVHNIILCPHWDCGKKITFVTKTRSNGSSKPDARLSSVVIQDRNLL